MFAARDQNQYGFWLIKTGQVVKIAVLTKGVLGVPAALLLLGRGHNRYAIGLHQTHEVFAPAGKLSFADFHTLVLC